MNIIKISDQVFETILGEDIKPIDTERLPYNNFCVSFPYSFLRSGEDMVADSLKEFKRVANSQGIGFKKALEEHSEEIERSKQTIIRFADADLHVVLNDFENMEITVKHSQPEILGKSTPTILLHGILKLGFPVVDVNSMGSRDGMFEYCTFVKLISGVIYFINNPVEYEVSEEPAVQHSSSTASRPKNQNDIRYISGIKHKGSKHTGSTGKHVITLEAWEVRGHWRHYENGKKVWIESYVKGDKEKYAEKDNVYKLNKVSPF